MRYLSAYRKKDIRYNVIGISLSQRIFTILLILYPILNIYQSGVNVSLGIADTLMLVFLIIHASDVLKKKLVVTDYLLFNVYIVVISFINILSVSEGSAADLFRIVRHGFYGVVICVYMPHYFNLQYGISLMKKCSCVVCAGAMLQSLLYYVFHKMVLFWLPIEAFTGGELVTGRISHTESYAYYFYFRPSFVFVEPAHFSQYVIVGVLLFLFLEKRKDRAMAGALFCSLGILLSTSSGGILAMALGWGVWLLETLKRDWIKGKIKGYVLFIVLFLLAAATGVVLYTGVVDMVMGRLNGIGLDKASTSGNLRVLKGFLVFGKLNPWRKLIGLGLGNIEGYFTQMHMTTQFGATEYMSGFTYILNSTGLCGAVLLLVVLVRRMFSRNNFQTALSLVVLAVALGASIFNSGSWIVYMTFLLSTKKDAIEVSEMMR